MSEANDEDTRRVKTPREWRLEQALRSSMLALDDWLHQYAPEWCGHECVAESRKRVGRVGTIGYIAETQEKNREALKE